MEDNLPIGTIQQNEIKDLDWRRTGRFFYPGMVRIATPGDGSCLIHAILKSFFIPYITGSLDNKPLDRRAYVKSLRDDLAYRLSEPVKIGENTTVYDNLSGGKMKEFAKSVPAYSLENIQKLLQSNEYLGLEILELISNTFKKDIYILDLLQHDVYMLGTPLEYLYKDRPSIVILFLPNHFELIGLKTEDDDIKTLFSHNHPFIKSIRNRIDALTKD